MSKTKQYLFDINHPCTWVKGDGRGLPRKQEERTMKIGSHVVIHVWGEEPQLAEVIKNDFTGEIVFDNDSGQAAPKDLPKGSWFVEVPDEHINGMWAILNDCFDGEIHTCDNCKTPISRDMAKVWSDILVICKFCSR